MKAYSTTNEFKVTTNGNIEKVEELLLALGMLLG